MDKAYLEYPKRGYGQDHDFYDWRTAKDHAKIKWNRGAKVAICFIVPLEFFPLNPSGNPFKHPGAMVTPYPDLRHFTVRDYGNRVGAYRILQELQNSGYKATFAVNGEIAKRYPPLVEAVDTAGHEITAHGLSTDHIHHEGLQAADELKLIEDTLACFESKPKGWMSPARNQSSRTLSSIADAKLGYCLDWEMDSVPVATSTGVSLIPNSYELSDFTLLHTRKQTEDAWLKQMKNAIDLLLEEHDRYGGQMLGLTLTPYIIGQPFRIWALRALLAHIKDIDGAEVFTAGEIDKQFRAQQ
ncbi:MAG: polysaccharide deacetylase family protein [Alphaproteobacteria bacterium]